MLIIINLNHLKIVTLHFKNQEWQLKCMGTWLALNRTVWASVSSAPDSRCPRFSPSLLQLRILVHVSHRKTPGLTFSLISFYSKHSVLFSIHFGLYFPIFWQCREEVKVIHLEPEKKKKGPQKMSLLFQIVNSWERTSASGTWKPGFRQYIKST